MIHSWNGKLKDRFPVGPVAALCLTITLGFAPAAYATVQNDVLLLLDNSGSMRKNDPSRLAEKAVKQFISERGPETRVAVMEFSGRTRVLMPFTPVTRATRTKLLASVDRLNYGGRWTDTAAALEHALYELRLHGRTGARKSIVLMTDGLIDTGQKGRDARKQQWLLQYLAPEAATEKARIFGIAFTENADYQLLQALAEQTHAEYYRAFTPKEVGTVLERIGLALAHSDTSPAETAVTKSVPATRSDAPPPERIQFVEAPRVGTPQQAESAPVEHSGHAWLAWIAALLVTAGIGYAFFNRRRLLALVARSRLETPPATGPQAILYDINNPADIRRYELNRQSTIIGRIAGYDPEVQYVVAPEPTVGRCHALIERRGQTFWILDQGSVNGTFVNGERVSGECALKHGDVIRVHRHEFEFVLPELFDSEATLLAARESTTGREIVREALSKTTH